MNSNKLFLKEEDLILALKNQENIGMIALFDMYSDSLTGVISQITKNDHLSDDLFQEVILKIWNTIGAYQTSKGRLFSWMINVTKNHAIDTIRSKTYRNNRKNLDIDDCQVAIDRNYQTDYNPDTIGVRELVYNLGPKYHILLEMVYFLGYTHEETAIELNLPMGTVKTRIRTAIVELRKHFIC